MAAANQFDDDRAGENQRIVFAVIDRDGPFSSVILKLTASDSSRCRIT